MRLCLRGALGALALALAPSGAACTEDLVLEYPFVGEDAGASSTPGEGDGGLTATEPPGCAPDGAPTDLYVSQTGLASDPCTPAQPCNLHAALQRQPATIDLADGAYAGDIVIGPGTKLRGGWLAGPSRWKRTCLPGDVVIAGVNDEAAVRIVDAPDVAIEYLAIVSSSKGSGNSHYGLVALGPTTRVLLDHVHVTALPGLNGASGSGVPSVPPAACAAAPENGTGLRGLDGPLGAPGRFSFTARGIDTIAGGLGSPGVSGAPGVAAPGPMDEAGVTCASGSGGACIASACVRAPKRGAPGCGGRGGGGGSGGGSGGASIAVYAWTGARIATIAGTFVAGPGGDGGEGGPGGEGGLGTAGASGSAVATSCFRDACTCGLGAELLAGGAAGGKGGDGGRGGGGGGGAGGPAFGWVAGAGAVVTTTNTKITVRPGGMGGAPNGPPGPQGEHL